MADVTGAYLRGHLVGQNEATHQQELENNKLRTLVLKHEIDRLKIEDQLRARDVAMQNAQLLEGRPAAEMPSEEVVTPQADLPARSFAGTTSGLPGGGGPGITTPAPAAQAPPGTNTVVTTRPQAVTIPGVEGLGVGSVDVRPRTLEEMTRQRIAAQLTEPFTLGSDQTRYVGGVPVAAGPGKIGTVGRGGVAFNEKTGAVIARGQPANTGEFGQFQQAYAEGFGAPSFDALNAKQKMGVFAAFANSRRDPDAADLRQRNTAFSQHMREYQSYLSTQSKQHADAMKVWQQDPRNLVPDTASAPPEYAPDDFNTWVEQHYPEAPAGGTKKGGAKAAPVEGAAPKEGDKKPIPGYPGTEQTYKGGKWIRTK